jgi:hypothetical protein
MSTPAAEADPTLGEQIDAFGWRTGSAFRRDDLMKFDDWVPARIAEQIRAAPDSPWAAFLVSQACDVVCPTLEDEPFAELILGRLQVEANPELSPRKTYRRMQLQHPGVSWVEFRSQDRWAIDRSLLAKFRPDPNLDLTWAQGLELGGWVGGRYARLPLPNELVNRLNVRGKQAKKHFKALNNQIHEIRVEFTPHEGRPPEGQPYTVVMYVIANANALTTGKAKEAYDKFSDWTKNISGVVVHLRLRSQDDFTYAEYHRTHRLDLDLFTFGHQAGPDGAMPAGE